jgi:hypothetical protein
MPWVALCILAAWAVLFLALPVVFRRLRHADQLTAAALGVAASLVSTGWLMLIAAERPFVEVPVASYVLSAILILASIALLGEKPWGRPLFLVACPIVLTFHSVVLIRLLGGRNAPDIPLDSLLLIGAFLVAVFFLSQPAALSVLGVEYPGSIRTRVTKSLLVATVIMTLFSAGDILTSTRMSWRPGESPLDHQIRRERMAEVSAMSYILSAAYIGATAVCLVPRRRRPDERS